ncbi:MAG: 1-deoxy-D-xylulose-5-phosphate reductoisomerase [Pseudomonadota bacterium]
MSGHSPNGLRPAPRDGRRRVSVLGSTGSIGVNTLDVLADQGGAEAFEVVALTANGAAEKLAAQAIRFKAQRAVVADPAAYRTLKDALSGSGVEAAAGPEAVEEAAAAPAEWVMAAIVGAAGLRPSFAAARQGATVALANKETLVCAGDLFLDAVRDGGGALIPVDSEHNAIFQCFDRAQTSAVERIILTASGGPFRARTRAEMAEMTPAQALKHPNWSMGAKISIDSATMFNKALEVIEAARLFPVPQERIEVLVHPQSIVHSMVGYRDGSVLAQLGAPDMRTPIAFALGWPERISAPVARLDLAEIGRLDFERPDLERFPALRLAREALAAGGAAPTALNAANEVAVAAFLDGRIGFLDIARLVEGALAEAGDRRLDCLADVEAVDQAVRAACLGRATPRARGAAGAPSIAS